MIFGDTLIVTKEGIEVSGSTLQTIGIYENSQVHMLPFRTYEYRTHEQGVHFPMDLLITPIQPKDWPFVIRFVLRIYNRPGVLEQALALFNKLSINILFYECTRSGHHHSVLNVLGVIKRLESRSLKKFHEEIEELILERSSKGDSNIAQNNENAGIEKKDENKTSNSSINPWWYYALETFTNLKTTKTKEDNIEKAKTEEDNIEYKIYKEFFKLIKKTDPDLTHPKIEIRFNDLYESKHKFIIDKQKNFSDDNYDKALGNLVGEFLFYKYGMKETEFSLSEILEFEIERIRPLIRLYEKEFREKRILNKDLYKKVENEIVPLKCILRAIINYKQLLCNKFEILILRDTLIKDDLDFQNKNLVFNLLEYENYIKEERYIYNLVYYIDQAKFRRFSEEIFLDVFNIKPELFFEKLFKSKSYLKKIEEKKIQNASLGTEAGESTEISELLKSLKEFYIKYFDNQLEEIINAINAFNAFNQTLEI
ncbi:MAG TPA: hypothetical protein DEP28_06825, partial [Bacteroidetes bacterium]|nr:hypothetical protein [Bacteroidota bacterium]